MSPFEQMPGYLVFIIQYAALLLCISVHESAHALSAHLLGDETANLQGRISLNPLAHIDMFGTVIFPIMAFLFRIPVIGWAKPVSIDPRNLRDFKRDDIIISASGPASNLLLAFLLFIISPLMVGLSESAPPIFAFYTYLITINIILAFFNLIPVPPLDGSGVLRGFLPDDLAEKYDRLQGFGFILIYILLFSGVLDLILGVASQFYRAIGIAAGVG